MAAGLWRQVDPESFGYSSITVMGVNGTASPPVVSLGVLYEGVGGLRWTVISDFLPSA
jgi:hypothetical protein